MAETKVVLTLTLQGRTMLSPQECGENPENYDVHKMNLSWYDQKKRRIVNETLVYRTRKNTVCKQVINISQDSYDYMVNTVRGAKYNSVIKGASKGDKPLRIWDTMPVRDRLRAHLKDLAKDFDAISFDFHILD